jgi:hypothetical protein
MQNTDVNALLENIALCHGQDVARALQGKLDNRPGTAMVNHMQPGVGRHWLKRRGVEWRHELNPYDK